MDWIDYWTLRWRHLVEPNTTLLFNPPPTQEPCVDLTDAQWEAIEPLVPRPSRRADGRRRPWRDPRGVLTAILWVLRTGAPWKDLPSRYPPYQTCHRRFQGWCRDGTIERILQGVAQDLYRRGGLDLSESFIDGTFTPPSSANSAC